MNDIVFLPPIITFHFVASYSVFLKFFFSLNRFSAFKLSFPTASMMKSSLAIMARRKFLSVHFKRKFRVKVIAQQGGSLPCNITKPVQSLAPYIVPQSMPEEEPEWRTRRKPLALLVCPPKPPSKHKTEVRKKAQKTRACTLQVGGLGPRPQHHRIPWSLPGVAPSPQMKHNKSHQKVKKKK